jgi:hypothetical protein
MEIIVAVARPKMAVFMIVKRRTKVILTTYRVRTMSGFSHLQMMLRLEVKIDLGFR